jgi:hypothetical protein
MPGIGEGCVTAERLAPDPPCRPRAVFTVPEPVNADSITVGGVVSRRSAILRVVSGEEGRQLDAGAQDDVCPADRGVKLVVIVCSSRRRASDAAEGEGASGPLPGEEGVRSTFAPVLRLCTWNTCT